MKKTNQLLILHQKFIQNNPGRHLRRPSGKKNFY